MKKPQTLLVSLFLSFYFLISTPALAVVTGTPFAGVIHSVIPCSCSPTLGFAVNYTPVFISSPLPVVGALYYAPELSVLFSWYNPITPTVWNLGKFVPSAGECWVGAAPYCVVYPTIGHVIYEGTSALPKVK